MSYCRWSSNDYACDVYVYESCYGGWMIHVAGNRIVGDIPKTDHLLNNESLDQFMDAYREQLAFLETCKREPIGLKYDGFTFCERSPEDAADKLEELRDAGYLVPQYAIDALRDEAAEDRRDMEFVDES